MREVDPIRQSPDRRLENMGRGRCTTRFVPAVLPIEQGRLLLRASNRDTEILVFTNTQRVGSEIGEYIGDLLVADPHTVDNASRTGIDVGAQKLECTHAVVSNRAQQVV